MKLGYSCNRADIAFKLFAVVILGRVSCGRTGTEERTVLRSMGIVLLQMSAEGTGNASAVSLHISGDEQASPQKPVPRCHGRGIHAGQWWQFVRIQTATKDGINSETIALGCVAVVVVVILGIFLTIETSQSNEHSLKDLPMRKRWEEWKNGQRQRPLRQTPVEVDVGPTRTVSSATPPGERGAGPTTLRSAPPTEATYAYPAATAHAPPIGLKPNFAHAKPDDDSHKKPNVPPLSLKGKFLQATPHSSEENLEYMPQSLPPTHTGSRRGTQTDIQNSYLIREGRQSPPHNIERSPMSSMGITPVGSASKLQDSLGDGALLGGEIVGTSQELSFGNPPPLCKELILPQCEIGFAIAFEHLNSTQNEDFDIYGLSGKPLLRASTRMEPCLQKVSLSMKPPKSPTLASIHAVNPIDNRAKKKMTIRSKNDEYYADFIDTGGMRYVVKRDPSFSGRDSRELMTVTFDRAQGQFIISSSTDGALLGTAMQSTSSELNETFGDKAHLEVRVNTAADPVLALLCFIAAILFNRLANLH